MSGGAFCHCDERHKPVRERAWVVTAHRCNYSAFNGYRRTPSDYSEVHCPKCLGVWRTKAAYVEELPLGNLSGVGAIGDHGHEA